MAKKEVAWFALCLLAGILLSCKHAGERNVTGKPIEQVLREQTDYLMSILGVVGTAIGQCDGSPCIKVLVVKKTPQLQKRIPSALENWKVEIEETGVIRPL